MENVYKTPINYVELIVKKRDKGELTDKEIKAFVDGAVDGTMQECQIGAMLMAMLLNGLSDNETFNLTKCMIESGDVMSWPSEWSSLLVDKHSTGGVGDKISLILTPALAACGAKVPMICGRGLDITGGTLDKLESIPGYQVEINYEAMFGALSEVGCFMAGQSARLIPADKELYKCRDVTGTVPSVGLIVGSILSKKCTEGTKSLILDLKVGKAAFFKSVESARELANKIISTSKLLGLRMRVALTQMDTPIGCYVGNSLEVAESVYALQGNISEDVECLVKELGGHLLELSGIVNSVEEGRQQIKKSIEDGSALDKFCKMITHHGVDPKVAEKLCKDPWSVLPKVPPSQVTVLKVNKSGIVKNLDAFIIGQCSRDLGAGRLKASQSIDLRVGVISLVKEGQRIQKGSPWLEVHHSSTELPLEICTTLEKAITIEDDIMNGWATNDISTNSIILEVLE